MIISYKNKYFKLAWLDSYLINTKVVKSLQAEYQLIRVWIPFGLMGNTYYDSSYQAVRQISDMVFSLNYLVKTSNFFKT